jgi:branched-chain amino acid transport system substrate-binding protein
MTKQTITRRTFAAGAAAATLAGTVPARAQTRVVVPSLSDFSGPFAPIMPSFSGGREAVLSWWNGEVGNRIGLNIAVKAYDTRYDVAQTASLWPGILAELKPAIGFALGGPDTAALQQRLPQDKVVMIHGTAQNGFAWRPDQWILTMRPTFVHEMTGFIAWFHKEKVGGSRPVKIGMVSSEASPSFADMTKGIQAFARANPTVVQLVEVIFAELQPADLTLPVRRLVNAGVDVILTPTTVQQAVATKRALQALRSRVPVMTSAHNSPGFIAPLIGGIQNVEGDYEAHSTAIPSDEDTAARRFYQLLTEKHGLKAPWNTLTVLGIGQALLLARVVQATVAKHGAGGLTGDNVYATLMSTEFPAADFNGFLPAIAFTRDASFPNKDPRVNIGVVKGGKMTTAATDVACPPLSKW